MYHLIDEQERYRCMMEANRVLKVGGYVFAVAISRFASTIDGIVSGYFLDPEFQKIMIRDIETGQHRNPSNNPAYFMDTYFHHPDELKNEVARAGFDVSPVIAVEGISYMMKDFDKNWAIDKNRAFLLDIISKIETEPSLIGASPHIMCVGMKL
jgi:hypothetical protein